MAELCTCCSNKPFNKCCGRFLRLTGETKTFPKTPEQLMRSRYSAYALGGYGDYLLDTWLPVMTQGMTALELSQIQTQWIDLEVLNKSQKGDDGFVEFKAGYLDQDNNKATHHEHSVFKRINGKWLYVGGEVNTKSQAY